MPSMCIVTKHKLCLEQQRKAYICLFILISTVESVSYTRGQKGPDMSPKHLSRIGFLHLHKISKSVDVLVLFCPLWTSVDLHFQFSDFF